MERKMDRDKIDLLAIIDQGAMIQLSDGSLFRVDPFDLPEVKTWTATSEIELAETQDSVFNYTLTNRNTNSWIRATKEG